MPRIKRGFELSTPPMCGDFVDQLAAELHANHEGGQPVIEEQEFPNGNLRVTVLWDHWERLPLEERTSVILAAYEKVEGESVLDKIALASGLTFPEAYASGMLPFQIIAALRKGDPVTAEECKQALIAEGASTLLRSDHPQLRFATLAQAEAAQHRLVARLPKSDEIWAISQEAGKVMEWTDH